MDNSKQTLVVKNNMEHNLKTFNELWAILKLKPVLSGKIREMRPLTQEEYNKELKDHPDLWKSYYLMEQVSKKYAK